VFLWVLGLLADRGLLKGGRWEWMPRPWKPTRPCARSCSATTAPATTSFSPGWLGNPASRLRPGRIWRAWTASAEEMFDKEWVSPSDPDARITKMKDGTTHLAHKAEHAVDMESGAVIAVTLQGARPGRHTTIRETLAEAGETVAHLIEREVEQAPKEEP